MTAIKLANISKRYHRTNRLSSYTTLKTLLTRKQTLREKEDESQYNSVLKDVSFEVQKGTVMGVIGKNGAGKSTLLKIIYGLLKPDCGTVTVSGRVSAIIELGVGFHPDLTGRENLLINSIIMGLTKKEVNERMDEIIDFSGIHDYIDEPLRTYSSGMNMRLGFSIAINSNPDILLTDEVHAVGDEAFRIKCMQKIDQLKDEGKTILIVTHDLKFVESWCSGAVWINDGKIGASGNPGQVVSSYKHSLMNMAKTVKEKNKSDSPILITQVYLKGNNNEQKNVFHIEENINLSVSLQATEEILDIVFGIAIFNENGMNIYGTNTFIDDIPALKVKSGPFQFSLFLEKIKLLPGQYFIDVDTHKKDGTPYHSLKYVRSFIIESEKREDGVCRLAHRWNFGGEKVINHK